MCTIPGIISIGMFVLAIIATVLACRAGYNIIRPY